MRLKILAVYISILAIISYQTFALNVNNASYQGGDNTHDSYASFMGTPVGFEDGDIVQVEILDVTDGNYTVSVVLYKDDESIDEEEVFTNVKANSLLPVKANGNDTGVAVIFNPQTVASDIWRYDFSYPPVYPEVASVSMSNGFSSFSTALLSILATVFGTGVAIYLSIKGLQYGWKKFKFFAGFENDGSIDYTAEEIEDIERHGFDSKYLS